MSSEKTDSRSSEEEPEKFDAVIKKPKFSYPREFLLSLSDLDICKKLPNGFDESLLSEFEDAGQSVQDRPRIPGSHPLQSFRRNQYGSSPPTRGDSNNYSRGTYGKWDSHSSARNDRDSDSQSDRDSDSGKRYGHPSQRSSQSTEHDGLLGSGSFPRPSGLVSGIYAPKFKANEDYQLKKSSEPYHPPRPSKAVPYSRRDTDSYNDETFGSMECENEDRAQEERRRRASFELIRKEQQKALQEKQNLNLGKHKSTMISDLSEILEDKMEEMGPFTQTELDASAATIISSNNADRSFASLPPASIPLVPPGFNNGMLEKSSGMKYQIQTPLLEKPVSGKSVLDPDVNLVLDNSIAGLEVRSSQETNIVNGQPLEKTSPLDKGVNGKSLYRSHVHVRKTGVEDQVAHASARLDSHETLDDPGIVGPNSDASRDIKVGEVNRKFSTSILAKVFGGALSINDDGSTSSSAEHRHSKPDDKWSHHSVQSSKFTQWFSEEEAELTDDISSGRPNELLSLISGSGKDQRQVSDSEAANLQLGFSLELPNKLTLDLPPAVNSITDQACADKKEESISTVITCEDLEQSILTQYSAKNTSMKPLSEGLNATDLNTEQASEHAGNHASLHLLSLLQKRSSRNNTSVNSDVGLNLEDKPLVSQEHDMNMAVHEHKHEKNDKNINLGKTITLEALFGSAFMTELQSVEAPVSVQRGSNESNEANATVSLESLFPIAGNIFPSSATDINVPQRPSHNHGLLSSNDGLQMRPTKGEKWLGLDDSGNGSMSSNDHQEEVSKRDGFGTVEFQPPEVNINPETDTLSHRMWTFMPTRNSVNDVDFSLNGLPIEILDKLAPINAVKDDRVVISENLPFTHPPYPNLDPQYPYPGLQLQKPLTQFQSPQMAPLRPLHNKFEPPLDHMSSQMNFLGPEPMFNHYSSANHRFPSKIIQRPLHHPNIGIAGLDVQSLASMQHQLQLSGSHSHLVPSFPRGGPVPHPGHQAAGFIQETNQMPGSLPETRKLHIGSPGLSIPVPAPYSNSGHNPPELYQRVIEMGVQANSKHTGYNQGVYGHVSDMGFHYRELR